MSREHIDQDGGTFEVNSTGLYPRVHVDTAKVAAVAQAGGVLLTETIRAAGQRLLDGITSSDCIKGKST